MKSKYVIVELEGTEVPLIFSPFLQHEDVALVIRNKVHSAGFCELDLAGKWIASGGSVSLKLSARPQDANILNEHLGATTCPHQTPCKPTLTVPSNAKT